MSPPRVRFSLVGIAVPLAVQKYKCFAQSHISKWCKDVCTARIKSVEPGWGICGIGKGIKMAFQKHMPFQVFLLKVGCYDANEPSLLEEVVLWELSCSMGCFVLRVERHRGLQR